MIALTALAVIWTVAIPASAAFEALPTTVMVEGDAHHTEVLAAEELARYMELAGGGEVLVATAPAGDGAGAIHVGAAAQCSLPADLPPDGFVIERDGADVHLRGADPRGTLYAAYRYLEEAVGWRWLQPGNNGEVLTDAADAGFPRERIVDAPALPMRGLVRPWREVQRWYARLGMNWGLAKLGWDLTRTRPLMEEASLSVELGEHGFTYYAEEGETLCPHDPASIHHATQNLSALIDEHPWVEAFGFWPEDGYFPFCQCEQCGRIDPRETLDGRYLRLFNPVARAIGERHPSVRVGLLAYNNYLRPPDEPEPHTENTVLAFAAGILHADILGSSSHQEYIDALRQWRELGMDRIWIYEYYFTGHEAKRFNLLFPHAIAREIRLVADLGASGLMAQINNPPEINWGVGLNYYVMARLLWDPEADVEALVRRYCHDAWGPAAETMTRFAQTWERASVGMFRLSVRPEEATAEDAAELQSLIARCAEILARADAGNVRPEGRPWLDRWRVNMRGAAVYAEALGHWREAVAALEDSDGPAARRAAVRAAATMARLPQAVGEVQEPELHRFLAASPLVAEARATAEAIRDVGLQVRAPKAGLRLLPVKINRTRGPDELVIYTPEHGETTGTNMWGVEVVVSDGEVVDVQIRQGDAAIPADGFVLSGHRAAGYRLWKLQVGDRITLEHLKAR
ncbi:MAG: DUF4838 domain-containing protein [Armatimonadota bacterium]